MSVFKLGALSCSAITLIGGFHVTAPAMAQEEVAEDARKLDTVVVTANKREQTLQEISSAVSVVSPELMADAQINTLEDLQVAAPGLTVGNDFALAKVYIRGIGLNSTLPGMDPSVALHVDGAVVATATQHFASLFDLERVEVLRGPQGTLYGRNATGGSINLITAKPTDDFEAYTNLTVGGPELNFIGEGAISGPLFEGVQGRLAVRYHDREGYGTHTGSGTDIDDANKLGLRAQLNFDLAANVSNTIMAEYYEEDERSKAVKYFGPSFSNALVDSLLASPPQIGTDGMGAPIFASADNINYLRTLAVIPGFADNAVANSRDLGGDLVPSGTLETTSFTNTFEWDANDFFTLRSITNFREGESFLVQDFDTSDRLSQNIDTAAANLPAFGAGSTVQVIVVENEQLSQEFQAVLDGRRWRGIVGAYYHDETLSGVVPIGADPVTGYQRAGGSVDAVFNLPNGAPLNALLPDARVIIPGEMNIEAAALFANFTFDLTDSFRVKLGGRYSEEDRDIISLTRLPGRPAFDASTGTCAVPSPLPPVFGSTLGDNNCPFPTALQTSERSYDDFTPEIGFEFDFGESLFYGTYSEGFKSGTAALVDPTPFLIEPETIENYELGLKGTYWDGTLNFGIAGFVYTIDNVQYDRTTLTSAGARFDTSVENAGSTDGQGIEVEGSWQATEQFRLDFNGTWYDIEFSDFDTTNPLDPIAALQGLSGLPVDRVNLAGNRPRNTPEYSFGVRGTYSQDLANGGAIDWSAAYAYKDEQFFTEFNESRSAADAYGILDANVKYTFPNQNLSVNLWGKNLTDEFVRSGVFAISTSRAITGTYLPPLSYGVTLGYTF